jgi:hypothetical protein
MRTGKMTSLDDVKERARSVGNHFFDPGAMRSFGSRISENVYPTDFGTYIVTSERDRGVYTSYGFSQAESWAVRRYTIRFVDLAGIFHSASEFGQYLSYSGAHKAAERMQKTGHPTCQYHEEKCPHDWSENA